MRKIIFTTYPCSGVTAWLSDCMMELGIMYKEPNMGDGQFTFIRKIDDLFDEYEVNRAFIDRPGFGAIEQWVSSFAQKGRKFLFRNDITFNFTSHQYALPENLDLKTIIGIRDPRDTMLSTFFCLHTREEGDKFYEYCQENIPNWVYFYEDGLKYKNSKIVRFEDRKKDEFFCLKEISHFIDVKCSDEEIRNAVNNCSFEKAKLSEEEVIQRNKSSFAPGGRMIKSGAVEQYKLQQNQQFKKAFDHIVEKAAPTMKKYGYTKSQIYGHQFCNAVQVKKIFSN